MNYLWGPPVPITTSAPRPIDLSVHVRPLTREELFEQKVSFVYGQVASDGITKEQVRRVLSADYVPNPSSNETEVKS